jgi:hypothetical protein
LVSDFADLSKAHPTRVFIGESDPLIEAGEVVQTLGRVGLDHTVERVPGSHASLLARIGHDQMARSVVWAMSTEQQPTA